MRAFSRRMMLASAALFLVLPAVTFAGIDQPPPQGFHTVYIFTGAKDNTINTATVVHCTNFNDQATTIQVEFFDFVPGVLRGSFQHTLTPGETVTVGSRHTAFYSEFSADVAVNLGQGSARVVSTRSEIICTAQMVDSDSNPPSFIVPLPGFDKGGKIR